MAKSKKLFSTKGFMPKMNWANMTGIKKGDIGLPKTTMPKFSRINIKKLLRDI